MTRRGKTLYGFCDYTDALSAKAAVQHLNGKTLGGSRIRLVIARPHGPPNPTGGAQDAKRPRDDQDGAAAVETLGLPPTDPLNVALNEIPIAECYEAIEQLRLMVLEAPQDAACLLRDNPQLRVAAVAILQHAGRLPQTLPPEAFEGAPDSATPATSAANVTSSAASSSSPTPETLQLLQALSAEEIDSVIALSAAELASMPAATRAQMAELQRHLKAMAAQLT